MAVLGANTWPRNGSAVFVSGLASNICVREDGQHEILGHVVMISFYLFIRKTDVISGPSVKTQEGYLAT
jgi:hypothetical protein